MLTDTQVRSARPSERPRKLTDSRGLYLQVMPNGGKYWRYDYSFKSKRRTLAFGVYPDVSLGKARERHHEARRLLAEEPGPWLDETGRQQRFRGSGQGMARSLEGRAHRAIRAISRDTT